MAKRKKTKKILEAHFKMRMRQRFNLTGIDVDAICRLIWTGKAQHVENQSLNRSIFIVDCEGLKIKVVYDKRRKTLVTALP